MRDVIHTRHQVGRPELAIRADAAEGRAAQVHAVIRALAADDLGALGLTLEAAIGEAIFIAVSTASEAEFVKNT